MAEAVGQTTLLSALPAVVHCIYHAMSTEHLLGDIGAILHALTDAANDPRKEWAAA